MDGGLGDGLGDDGPLFEFDAEAEVDDGVEGAVEHAGEDGVGDLGVGEAVLGDDGLVAAFRDEPFEEDEEVGVLRLVCYLLVELVIVVERADDFFVDRWGWSLSWQIVFKRRLYFLWRCPQGQ